LERDLFVRLAICVDPTKAAASGLSERAVRSLGARADGLSDRERQIRSKLKAEILAEVTPFVGSSNVLPGLGPHVGFPDVQQYQIAFPQNSIEQVAKKIVRGCEYTIAQKRFIEAPYALQIYFAHESEIQDVIKVFKPFGPIYLGPGFRVTRAPAVDESMAVMYKIDIWDTWTIYGVILPEPQNPAASVSQGG